MRLKSVLLMRRAVAQMRAHADQGRTFALVAGRLQRAIERREIVAVGDLLHMPIIGLEPFAAIFGEGDVGARRKRDVVFIVKADELAEPQMTGERSGLGGDALHHVAIAHNHEGAMIDDIETGAVEARRQMALRNGEADCIGEALAERSGRDFDARRQPAFGMARRLAFPLPEALDLLERQIVAGKMQERVEQSGAVTGGQYEAIPVVPFRIFGVVLEESGPQHIGHRRGAERQAGMAAVGLLNHVDGEKPKRIDAALV